MQNRVSIVVAIIIVGIVFLFANALNNGNSVKKSNGKYLYEGFSVKSRGMRLPLVNTVGIQAKNTSVGQYAPDFTLTDVDGNVFSLSDFQGKPVILDFMATWCGMTALEMENYKKLVAEYGDQIQIISIDTYKIDSDYELKLYKDRYSAGGKNWIYAIDKDNKVTLTYGVDRSVTTFIIDKNGVISYKDDWITDYDTLKTEIEKVS